MDEIYGQLSQPVGYYGGESAQGKMAIQPTLKQRLDMAVNNAEARLKAVKEAREIFERNPDLEKLLDVMQKGLFLTDASDYG